MPKRRKFPANCFGNEFFDADVAALESLFREMAGLESFLNRKTIIRNVASQSGDAERFGIGRKEFLRQEISRHSMQKSKIQDLDELREPEPPMTGCHGVAIHNRAAEPSQRSG